MRKLLNTNDEKLLYWVGKSIDNKKYESTFLFSSKDSKLNDIYKFIIENGRFELIEEDEKTETRKESNGICLSIIDKECKEESIQSALKDIENHLMKYEVRVRKDLKDNYYIMINEYSSSRAYNILGLKSLFLGSFEELKKLL